MDTLSKLRSEGLSPLSGDELLFAEAMVYLEDHEVDDVLDEARGAASFRMLRKYLAAMAPDAAVSDHLVCFVAGTRCANPGSVVVWAKTLVEAWRDGFLRHPETRNVEVLGVRDVLYVCFGGMLPTEESVKRTYAAAVDDRGGF